MAVVALGLGTSHSQHVNLPVELWAAFAEKDKTDPRVGDFEGLSRQKAGWIEKELRPEVWRDRHDRVQAAISRISVALAEAAVDAVITIGDDQHEAFSPNQVPALGIYWGSSMENRPPDGTNLTAWQRRGQAGYFYEQATTYPGEPELGRHLIRSLSLDGFDITQCAALDGGFRIGHAFNFVYRRLMGEHVVPQVPVFLNSYYPPNQPTVGRCYALGQAIGRAIQSWNGDRRVAVIASGGLSHFVVDEAIDRKLIAALEAGDAAALTSMPEEVFVHGTSEIKMWIALAGVTSTTDAKFRLIDYLPLYRTTAGSGIGACFGVWQ